MVQPQTRQIFFISGIAVVFKIVIHVIQFLMMDSRSVITLTSGSSTATVNLFGATLTSWKVDGKEVLFVSEKSLFDNKKAIRGGVPFVFPQFGPWDVGPQHGFARISLWSKKGNSRSASNSVTLVLEDSEHTRSLWDYKFRIEYTLTLMNEKLKMDVMISNTGDNQFSFNLLLHTYFLVPDVSQCRISGMKQCTYIDKLKDGIEFVEEADEISVNGATDRVYKNTHMKNTVTNISGNRNVTIEKFNFPDTVVWNPGSENAKAMSDFGDNEWPKMICVEAGYVNQPFILHPLSSFSAYQILTVE